VSLVLRRYICILLCSALLLALSSCSSHRRAKAAPPNKPEDAVTIFPPDTPTRTPSGEAIYRVGEGITAPHPIYAPDPEYARLSSSLKVRGTVTVLVVLGSDGIPIPSQLRVIQSLAPDLDHNTIETVKQWRFTPAMKGDQPVAAVLEVHVSFNIL
jgi:protein TonB